LCHLLFDSRSAISKAASQRFLTLILTWSALWFRSKGLKRDAIARHDYWFPC
jgi:hypothetical protein